MNTRRRLEDRKKSLALWAHLCGSAVFLFPLTLQKLDFRSSVDGGLAIRVHKASPAYAALEDVREDYRSIAEEWSTRPAATLAAGTKFDFKPHPTQQRVIVLQGMTIKDESKLRPQPFMVAGLSHPRAESVVVNRVAEPRMTDNRGELLPLVERKRRLIEYHSPDDVGTVSARELAKDLVREEVQNSIKNYYGSNAREIPTQSGQPIYVAATDRVQPPRKPSGAGTDLPIRMAQLKKEESPVENKPEFGLMSLVEPDPEGQRPVVLSGQIEMTGGLAFLGTDTSLSVKRIHQGQSYEAGHIWITEGRFEIRVKKAVGRLVAELSARGDVIGRGEVDLLTVHGFPVQGDRLEGLKIPIRPTSEGTSVQIISAYSHGGEKIPMTKARVEIDSYTSPTRVGREGMLADQSLAKDSSFIVKAESTGHYSSMAVATANSHKEIQMYPKTMVQALIDLALEGSERKQALRQPIVWGRVMIDGVPASNAQVELAGSSKPIYLNELYIPESGLKKTSGNGVFAFLQVAEGVQSIRVIYKGQVYPAQVFPTENEVVSYVELQLQEKVRAQFNIYDMLDPERKMAAHIRVVGVEHELPVNSGGYVEFPAAADPFVVEADAGEPYALTRVAVNGTPDKIDVPTVRTDWLQQLAHQKGLQLNPRLGTIVGFIEDQSFDVELSGYRPRERMDIVYFDLRGNIVEVPPTSGGGFAIFNAPAGIQTLIVHPQYSKQVFSQVVVAEPAFVHITKYNFSR